MNGRTCTVAASILLLRRYTERHDFTARVYDDPSPTGAPPGTGRSESALTRDCVDVRVAFDDDASAMQVLLECNRAMSSPTDAAANGAPDVIIATLRPGVDPDLAADALHAELEPDDSSARRARRTSPTSRDSYSCSARGGARSPFAPTPPRGGVTTSRRPPVTSTSSSRRSAAPARPGTLATRPPPRRRSSPPKSCGVCARGTTRPTVRSTCLFSP
jgi:hypothetical protein